MKANVTYTTGEHDYIYRTNSEGLITSVQVDELKFKNHDGRLKHNSKTLDKQKGDHAGHLIADRFGGSGNLDNLVSQNSHVNLSDFKKIENIWADALSAGKKVSINIDVVYGGYSRRPTAFNVQYTIDGSTTTTVIDN